VHLALAAACAAHEERLYLLGTEPLEGSDELEERGDCEGGIDLRELCEQAGEECAFQERAVA